jgi:ABC-type hemin transport system, ATPase component
MHGKKAKIICKYAPKLGQNMRKVCTKVPKYEQYMQSTRVAIVESVGAGKSSLVSALCGEMDKISGRVNTKVNLSDIYIVYV